MSTETNEQPLTLFEASTLEAPPLQASTLGAPTAGAVGAVPCPDTVEAPPEKHRRSRGQGPAAAPVPALASELRPRERLLSSGAEALSAAELLALVLGGECRGSLDLAADVISQSGGLAGLPAASCHDLVSQDAASPEGALSGVPRLPRRAPARF